MSHEPKDNGNEPRPAAAPRVAAADDPLPEDFTAAAPRDPDASGTGETSFSEDGFGLHRLYTSDGTIDETVEVRDGDVFLVPRGYHGPCVAAPGYPMYYLNVLAGPAPGRSMAFCDDPTHHWVREAWESVATDPRCPMTSAAGVVNG